MKSLLFFLGIVISISILSCSKSSVDASSNYIAIADTGHYYVQTGTITVTAPEGTYTFNGSKDNILIYHRKEKTSPELWIIGCFGLNGGGFEIDVPGGPTIGNTKLNYSTFTFPPPQNLNYNYRAYSNTNAGNLTLNTYNSNGIAASGTFTGYVGKYFSTYAGYTRADNINYTITGSFDLKLNQR